MPALDSPVDHTMAPLLVLDTNVVLDWLVFRDPGCQALAGALATGKARWVATAPMRQELEHVLAGGSLRAWAPDSHFMGLAWDRWVSMVPTLTVSPPGAPRCSDPDDQKFIDLALSTGASALLSRDRAVLKCARRARALGLEVLTPIAWGLRR